MDQDMRRKAAQTAVDAFKAVERIYRHAHQTVTVLKEEIKTANNLKFESDGINSSQSSTDPASWISQFKGVYLAHRKFSFEEYKEKEIPILFLQISIYNPDNSEPKLRYGIIKRIFKFNMYKNARFIEFVKEILAELHAGQEEGNMKMPHCEANVKMDQKLLLDLREDTDVETLANEIIEKYGDHLIQSS